MRLKAKFYVAGVTLLPGTQGVKLSLSAVSRGDRNAQWAQATPTGSVEMVINNPAAAAQVEEFMQAARRTNRQPEVFLDIAPSTDGWPSDGHRFRLADIPEGIYGHGNCGECGMPKDGTIREWDAATQRNVDTGRAYHPQG